MHATQSLVGLINLPTALFDRYFLCGAKGSFISAKLLDEPSSHTPALREAVAFLRYAAPRLGREWRYLPPQDAVFVEPDTGSEASDDELEEPSTLHFVVLSPGVVAKHIVLQLRLPVTLNEALRSVQASRTRDEVRKFSSLLPASPQPCPGSGVCLVLPAWGTADNLARVFLCFDLTSIDGRLFTQACPRYVSRRHLLHLSRLDDEGHIDVHFGDDPVPIDEAGQHQVETGDTVVFVPRGAVVPTLHSLAIDLFSGREWSRTLTVPTPPCEGAYGLVFEADNIFYTTQFLQPTAFRAHIAACIGVNEHRLRIFPSAPRVSDAAFDGHPCKTVIAVSESSLLSEDSSFCVLIDARAILLGWQTFIAAAGRVPCAQICATLQRDAPIGWRVYLEGVAAGTTLLNVHPGQVLVAAVAPASEPSAAIAAPNDSN